MIHINLLPGAAKRKRRQEIIRMLSASFTIFGFTVAGLAIVISLIYSQRFSLDNQIKKYDTEIADRQAKIAVYKDVIAETKLLRDKLTVINDLLGSYNRWARFFQYLTEATPSQGVKFVTVAATSDLKMSISGVADSAVDLQYLLMTFQKAHRDLEYQIQPGDTLARLAKAQGSTEALILEVNEAADESTLLAQKTITIPKLMFDTVDLASVNMQADDTSEREVDKNVSFALNIVFKQDILR
ncbi:hypothetical protein AUK40_03265 [Candidatus Wirthbacteria bacterium CG2_30_54_11]|uniref:LysM domain-containing protein n=1 Tax=Candidatus Wirthbacteria bacterium CG2_30_54_11 TaxID=1817892 RepID=A0A1J5J1N9_9BACT|nr:MAG: hypothetical protein AUK40_03265 [Candidatus Wirthbacteria bacterium CG2_30_54_11]